MPAELEELIGQFRWLLSTQENPVIVPGEAILGIEGIAAGIATPGRTILNLVTGPYGKNFGVWLERGGATVSELQTAYDDVLTVEAVAEAIECSHPCALAFVQAEAITGGSNPTEEILKVARRYNLITVVDSVSAIGAEPVRMDEWGMDFVAVGAQKALSGSNGVSAVGISARGWEFLESNPTAPRNSVLSLIDLRRSPDLQEPVSANIPVLEARTTIQALRQIREEGISSVLGRHKRAAASSIAAIRALGLEPWQRREAGYSPLVTAVRLPDMENWKFRSPIGILAPGDGELFGKLLRINHYGSNADCRTVEEAVKTLAGLLSRDPENAVSAVRKVWKKSDDETIS